MVAFFGIIIQMLHRLDRKDLRLAHAPGTIASAVSLGAQTGVGELLQGRRREQDFVEALRGKKFRIDPRTMSIVVEGEGGYEEAVSPSAQKNLFSLLGLQLPSPVSRRFSMRSSKGN